MNMWPSKTKMWGEKTRKIEHDKHHSRPNGKITKEDEFEDEYTQLENEIEKLKKELETVKAENEKNILSMEYLKTQVQDKDKEIDRLRCMLDKNTNFLQDTVSELVKIKSSVPAISPSVAAYLSKKDSTKPKLP